MTQYPQYQQQPLPPSNLPHPTGSYAPQQTEGLGSWLLTTFLLFIPVVNIIYLLVLAFGGSVSVAKKNFARASLIWAVVGIVLSIVAAILLASAGVSFFNELSNTYSTELNF